MKSNDYMDGNRWATGTERSVLNIYWNWCFVLDSHQNVSLSINLHLTNDNVKWLPHQSPNKTMHTMKLNAACGSTKYGWCKAAITWNADFVLFYLVLIRNGSAASQKCLSPHWAWNCKCFTSCVAIMMMEERWKACPREDWRNWGESSSKEQY